MIEVRDWMSESQQNTGPETNEKEMRVNRDTLETGKVLPIALRRSMALV
jgi:hypothetical protein